jgi:hypothetical protein
MSSAIKDVDLNRIVDLAARGYPESALQLLSRCDLSEVQKSTIRTLLTTPLGNSSQGPSQLKDKIVAALTGNATAETIPEGAISILPVEMLFEIFRSFDVKAELSPVSETCIYWHDPLTPEVCRQQLKEKESLTVKEIAIYQRRLGLEPDNWDDIFGHCRQLKKLDFADVFQEKGFPAREMEIMIESVSKNCPGFKILDFVYYWSVVEDKIMANLASNLPNLTHLRLQFCQFTYTGLKAMVQGCNNLVCLDLSYTPTFDEHVIDIAKHCPSLCQLNLAGCYLTFSTPVTDESIQFLAQKCSHLTDLSIPFAQITNASLISLGQNCKKLKYFYHYACNAVTGDDIDTLKQQLPQLETSEKIRDHDENPHFW